MRRREKNFENQSLKWYQMEMRGRRAAAVWNTPRDSGQQDFVDERANISDKY